jgi:hypothetical protein
MSNVNCRRSIRSMPAMRKGRPCGIVQKPNYVKHRSPTQFRYQVRDLLAFARPELYRFHLAHPIGATIPVEDRPRGGTISLTRKYPPQFDGLMSVRGFRESYHCSECGAVVARGQSQCINQHPLAWDQAAVTRAAAKGQTATQPTTFLETKIEWGVFFLYLVIAAVLGGALVFSLSKGTDYTTFASSIVTALTTIAGFAVGVNSGAPSTSTSSAPTQKK